jgi:hypothetical protein
VARTKEIFGAGPDNLLGYALAGSAAWGLASLAESPIDFYKSQMQKQLIQARVVRRVRGSRHARAVQRRAAFRLGATGRTHA